MSKEFSISSCFEPIDVVTLHTPWWPQLHSTYHWPQVSSIYFMGFLCLPFIPWIAQGCSILLVTFLYDLFELHKIEWPMKERLNIFFKLDCYFKRPIARTKSKRGQVWTIAIRGSITVWLVSYLPCLDSAISVHPKNNRFSYLVKSNPAVQCCYSYELKLLNPNQSNRDQWYTDILVNPGLYVKVDSMYDCT